MTVLLFGAHEVISGRITLGTLMTFYLILGMFYMPLQRLTDLAAVIANASAAIERIFDIFDIFETLNMFPGLSGEGSAVTRP